MFTGFEVRILISHFNNQITRPEITGWDEIKISLRNSRSHGNRLDADRGCSDPHTPASLSAE
ncbi:MAG: hypothetical protein B6D77_05090 [gamma proteobacterium symbiont of Ctena orbiculata]|nr:MAG: hypothetical protein B6D77_05090 [gamma proteobacterium symbiont of Ctena orbiculata]